MRKTCTWEKRNKEDSDTEEDDADAGQEDDSSLEEIECNAK